MRAATLAVNECCNYKAEGPYAVRHYCAERDAWGEDDMRCVFYQERFTRCKWFEDALAPEDPEAMRNYVRACFSQGIDAPDCGIWSSCRSRSVKSCNKCGQEFEAMGNRTRYCPECREQVRKEQNRRRKKRERAGVS